MTPRNTLSPCSIRRFSAVAYAALLLEAPPAYASGALTLEPDRWVLVALMVGFVILIAPLNSLIFKPLFKVLDARDAKIEGARRRASKLEEDAGTAIQKYRGAIRDVREEAEATRRVRLEASRSEQSSITNEARSEAEQEIARSRAEVAASLEEARASLRGAADGLARVAAERILGRSMT